MTKPQIYNVEINLKILNKNLKSDKVGKDTVREKSKFFEKYLMDLHKNWICKSSNSTEPPCKISDLYSIYMKFLSCSVHKKLWMDGRTDGWTDGQGENYRAPHFQCGALINNHAN